MSRRCPFCYRFMDIVSGVGAAHVTELACPMCGCEWCHGLSKLPDPDRLRREAGVLEGIADEIESNEGLAGRLREVLS